MPTPLDLFDFPLPEGLIAQTPVSPRDAARLLRVPREGDFADRAVRDLPDLLRPGDVMVFNDTRVLPVRLKGERPGGRCEVTLIEPLAGLCWRALARPARRLKAGERIAFAVGFAARVAEKGAAGEVVLDFEIALGASLEDALERHGAMPLPPYIRRPVAEDRDLSDYQTVYARHPGAVAAPTAGLHFTPDLLAMLAARGIGRAMVTLHVGLGTFQPVRAAHLEDHRMHAERGEVTAEAAQRIETARAAGGRVVAVGTTALRLLESAAASDGRVKPFQGATDLFIMPGYRFRAVDLLMTNFHLPRSTLFVLVSAFAGRERMLAAYAHAVARGYRFYSYGDASLLERAS